MNDVASQLTLEHVITQGEEQVSTVVSGAVVLMNVGTGQYFKLDDIGTRVWDLIEKPQSVRTICEQLAKDYDVEPSRCQADVLTLLGQMADSKLIRVAASA